MKILFLLGVTRLEKNLENCFATIDINSSELKYLSDHLTSEECRKLVAAAHFNSYDLPTALSEAELKISKDLSCFELLLHWNSSPGEGKGRSHELLERRLRQLDKKELADWLGNKVFDQVGKDLSHALGDEFSTEGNDTFALEDLIELPTEKYEDPTEWTPMDSVLFAILSILVFATTTVVCLSFCMYIIKKFKAKRKQKSSTKYENQELLYYSSSESIESPDVMTSESRSDFQS
ncbi:hypothetical protein WA026_020053 [Henosepilachna vigintioctopunctata]|uniref:Death domain-containing protein n=1 Tax=Henosepilachna vigintioctopunctata TaxID=420089 RepID=A0AAW1UB36_9CUCU